jgi:pimeloyl-ACP methyl ester carboxylesterase
MVSAIIIILMLVAAPIAGVLAAVVWTATADRWASWPLTRAGLATITALTVAVPAALFVGVVAGVVVFLLGCCAALLALRTAEKGIPHGSGLSQGPEAAPTLLDVGGGCKLSCWSIKPQAGSGQHVVYVHGGPGGRVTPDILSVLGAAFASRGISFHAYDQAGCGGSDPLPPEAYTVDRMVCDLQAILDAKGLGRVTLVASSWGSVIAARYALRYPERVERIVLFSPVRPQGVVYKELDFSCTDQLRPPLFGPPRLMLASFLIRLAPRTAPGFMKQEEGQAWGAAFVAPQVGRALHCRGCLSNVDPSRFALSLYPALRLPISARQGLSEDLIAPTVPVQVWRGECDYIPLEVASFYTSGHPHSALIEVKDEGHAVAFPDSGRAQAAAAWVSAGARRTGDSVS